MPGKDVYQEVTNKVLELLEKGVVPWHKPWACMGEAPKNLKTKKPYRGINVWLLGCSEYSSPYWLTYKQARDLNGYVRKGEKGTTVVFWRIIKKKEKNEKGEDTENSFPILRYYTVFNVEQCNGLDRYLPEKKEFKFDPLEQCETVFDDMPNSPNLKWGGERAYYRRSEDKIQMPPKESFECREEYYSTLFHETVHSTGHEDRLNRKGVTGMTLFGSCDYSKEELVAEMGAAFLCNHCGIANKTIDNSAAYLQGWLRRLQGDKYFVVQAASQAQKATDYILKNDPSKSEE